MDSATITVGNVRQSVNGQWIDWNPGDEPVKGKFGFSLSIGHKNANGGWDNYYCNDTSLFDYFAKGKTLTVEYVKTDKGNLTIKGVSTTQQVHDYADVMAPGAAKVPPYKADNSERDRSIQLQTHTKAWAEMYAGAGVLPTPAEFAANVLASHERVHAEPEPEPEFDEQVEALADDLDAKIQRED